MNEIKLVEWNDRFYPVTSIIPSWNKKGINSPFLCLLNPETGNDNWVTLEEVKLCDDDKTWVLGLSNSKEYKRFWSHLYDTVKYTTDNLQYELGGWSVLSDSEYCNQIEESIVGDDHELLNDFLDEIDLSEDTRMSIENFMKGSHIIRVFLYSFTISRGRAVWVKWMWYPKKIVK